MEQQNVQAPNSIPFIEPGQALAVQSLHGLEIGAVDGRFEGKLHTDRSLLLRLARCAAGILREPRFDDLHEADSLPLLCTHADSRLEAPTTLIHLLELLHTDGLVRPRKLHRRRDRQQWRGDNRCADLTSGLRVGLSEGSYLHLLLQHGEELLLVFHAFLLFK